MCNDEGKVPSPTGDEPIIPAEKGEPVCPVGGPAGRTGAPVVVIDLEDGVMVEEFYSEGKGIMPSAWNQTSFVVKEESVPFEATCSENQHRVPFVDTRRLRQVIRYRHCEELLRRL